jgi:ectoine hydroxylase-related dioxygenase (phytanoyl-CoA dioxygenase family)
MLDDTKLARWAADGFLILHQFIDAAAIAELRTAYNEVLDRRVAAAGDRLLGGLTRQVMMPSLAHPTFDDNAAYRAGVAVAHQLLGADVHRAFDMLIYKPPLHPHETPWHQDVAYDAVPTYPAGRPVPQRTIQFWVPLDDVDAETGCMHFVPGYHTRPSLEHRVASGRPTAPDRLLALTEPGRQLDLVRVVAAPLPAGGATLHAPGTPHLSSANRSPYRPRRAYIFNLTAEAGG